jgi:surfeit locus 1 family protein
VSRRALAFVLVAVVVAAGCVRLGIWQLQRLAQRRALNSVLAARLESPPLPVQRLLADSASTYRRATATGTYDFANEVSLAARTHQGSPGVNIVTPLRLAGTDTAILVNRGWVYSPDAERIDFGRWLEPTAANVNGYLLQLTRGGRGPAASPVSPRIVRRLDFDSLAKRLPYPIARFVLVATPEPSAQPGTPPVRDSTPARLSLPLMDEGPHLGYAIQWFSFALIALVGGAVGVRIDRRGSYHAQRVSVRSTNPSERQHG